MKDLLKAIGEATRSGFIVKFKFLRSGYTRLIISETRHAGATYNRSAYTDFRNIDDWESDGIADMLAIHIKDTCKQLESRR